MVIGFLLVYNFILLWMLRKIRKQVKLLVLGSATTEHHIFHSKVLEPIGEIVESPADLAYLKEKGFIK